MCPAGTPVGLYTAVLSSAGVTEPGSLGHPVTIPQVRKGVPRHVVRLKLSAKGQASSLRVLFMHGGARKKFRLSGNRRMRHLLFLPLQHERQHVAPVPGHMIHNRPEPLSARRVDDPERVPRQDFLRRCGKCSIGNPLVWRCQIGYTATSTF